MPSQARLTEEVNDTIAAATGDQDLLELIQQGLQCSKPTGGTTQELRAADLNRFHSLLKVLVRACITAIPTKIASEGFEIAATQARNTISIITRNIAVRPEVLLSQPVPKEPAPADEFDNRHLTPLYKWIIPRLVHAASLLVNDKDERELGAQIEECVVDVIAGLTTEQGNGSEHIEGLTLTQKALWALRNWSWESLIMTEYQKSYMFADEGHSHKEMDELPVLDDSPFFIIPPMSTPTRLSFILTCIRIGVSFFSPKKPPIPGWPAFFSGILVRMVNNADYFLQALRRAIEGDIANKSTKHLETYFWYHVKLLDICADLVRTTITLPSSTSDHAAYMAADVAAWWMTHRSEIMTINSPPQVMGNIKEAVLRTDTGVAGALEKIRKIHAARFGSPFWERLLDCTMTSVSMELEAEDYQQTDLRTILRCVLSPPAADSIRIAHSFSYCYFVHIKEAMQKRVEQFNDDAEAVQVIELLSKIEPAYETIRIANHRGMKRKRKDSLATEVGDAADPSVARISDWNLENALQTVQTTSWVDRRWKPLLEIVRSCGVGEGTLSELEDLTDRDLAGMEDDESKLIHHVLTCLSNALSNSSRAKPIDTSRWLKLLGSVCCLASGCPTGLCNSNNATLTPQWLQLWTDVVKLVPVPPYQAAAVPEVLEALQRIYHHACCKEKAFDPRKSNTVITWLLMGVGSSERKTRIKAGRCIVSLHRALVKQHPAGAVHQRMKPICEALRTLVPSANVPTQEAILSIQGQLARLATGDMLGDLILDLMHGLGSASHPLRSLAYVELLGVVRAHDKNPYTLISPYLNRISIHLVSHSVDVLNEGVQFLGVSTVSFLETTLSWTLPSLVLQRRRDALDLIVRITGRYLGVMLMDNMAGILSLLFMQDQQSSYEEGTRFLMGIFNEVTSESLRPSGRSPRSGFSLLSLLTSCTVVFLTEIIVNCGDASIFVVQRADQALRRAQSLLQGSTTNYGTTDIGTFLKDHMLGIISGMNDILVDGHGKKTLEEKQKVIRSLGGLIERVGSVIASFAPQIMTSIQTAMGIPPLRLEALRTWQQFIQSMRYNDLGQHIGPTIASLVVLWPDLANAEKEIAVKMIDYMIVDNLGDLKPFIDNVVDLNGIPELTKASANLMQERKSWPFKVALDKLLERCQHNNSVLSARSLVELKRLMLDRNADLTKLAKGDAFDPAISVVYQVLLTASGRDGDQYQSVRDAAYDCIGVLGALDPDRMQVSTPQASVVLKNNFADHDETVDFVLHVIETILVDAYRTTHDSKHQGHLSFTMQELLKFCKFSPKLNQQSGGGSISNKVRQRWAALSKEVLEVLTPLLEGKYTTGEISNRTYDHPIYTQAPTYREWLQKWTADLISRVMAAESPQDVRMEKQKLAMENAKAVFGAFRPIVRHQDVGVVHYLLPHLVLYTLITGTPSERQDIVIEINTVLQDQVNPIAGFSQDKRFFSAQAIFDLLDHLSRWLQEQRNLLRDSRRKGLPPLNDRVDKTYIQMNEDIKAVDRVLSSIDVELTAHAALQSKAYARSLRNFEERIAHLKHVEKRTDNDLQAYYEHLHRIYADLDEPDGMEGVSISVIAPSLEHQIREHESVGRWTSAQSCWEVKLQQSPNDVQLHMGLMRCLRNLGHYDTLRTHIRGVLSRWPDWSKQLASLQIEAAWTLSDWEEVAEVASSGAIGPNISIGKVLLAMHNREHEALGGIVTTTRRELGLTVTANHRQYARAYDAALHLHMLHEIELIRNSGLSMAQRAGDNRDMLIKYDMDILRATLGDRLGTTMPSYRVREPILGMRRTAFGLSPANQVRLKAEIGLAWVASSKNARKAGHEQTAYSATLQAKESDAPFAFVQQAKLLKGHGEALKALSDLENGLKPFLIEAHTGPHDVDATPDKAKKRSVAKALSLVARWSHEADRFSANDVVGKYKQAISLAPDTEGPYYQLGHYYDSISADHATKETLHILTCENYSMALRYGTKYIYQTMPRMLTLWLDLGEKARSEKAQQKRKSGTETSHTPKMTAIETINRHIKTAIKKLPAYQWLTAFAQIVSRIGHPSHTIKDLLFTIMTNVLAAYPAQAVWSMVGIYHAGGGQSDRALRCREIFAKFQAANMRDSTSARTVIAEAVSFSTTLLKLSNDPGHDPHFDPRTAGKEGPNHNKLRLSISVNFSYANNNFPQNMILPLQDALTCTLPSSAETVTSHNPFPRTPVVIKSLIDSVEIMPSLQRPKKIGFMGDDGKRYFFLVKPHDDLRKDARLMDFNSMINKLLKGGSESRKRQLHIRTYAVMPLNEECGLLEWVNNTVPFRNIVDKAYARHGKKLYSADIYQAIDAARKKTPQDVAKVFQREVLVHYSPPVFHEWFFQTWPEPTAWLAARLAYGRSLAVMSMVGFVLGLGDRHGENILFDSTTGDTVHVDFNCLFEKGKTFEIPERVPFRLTHNLVDGLGTTGVEGVYRKAAEIALETLRNNRDSLMSVLEAFIHDPLVEWEEQKRREERYRVRGKATTAGPTDLRTFADKSLQPINQKLLGYIGAEKKGQMSVANQVDTLIKEATSAAKLGAMYSGWASWL